MGYRDLGNHHHQIGDLQGSIRQHTKSRDYCTQTSHIVELCLSVIDASLESGNYAFVRNYVTKAEAAVETMAPSKEEKGEAAKSKTASVHMPGMVQGPSGLDPCVLLCLSSDNMLMARHAGDAGKRRSA